MFYLTGLIDVLNTLMSRDKLLGFCFSVYKPFCCITCQYKAFLLTWPVSMQIYWNKRKRSLKKIGSLSTSLRRPLLRRSWTRCPGESTSRSSPNFKLGSCSLAFAIIYQQQNSMVVKYEKGQFSKHSKHHQRAIRTQNRKLQMKIGVGC